MICLVTGGAGFIGSNLVDELIENNHKVVVIDDFALGNKNNLSKNINNPNLTIINKSVCDDLSEVFNNYKFDVVFHLAALPRVQFSIKEPKKTHEANLNGTLNLLNFCREFKVNRFIFSSSSSVYGDQDKMPLNEEMVLNPMSPYALHKMVGEYYCKLFWKLYNIETISLRYFNVYGPRQDVKGYACLIPHLIDSIKNEIIPKINGDGEQTRDFTFIKDVVNANILAANTKNEECFGNAFNIGAGRNISVNEVVKKVFNLFNKNVNVVHSDPVIEPRNTLADISKTKRLLNWEPKVSFEEGIKKTFEYFN